MTTAATPPEFRRIPLNGGLRDTRIAVSLGAGGSDRTEAAARALAAGGVRCLEVSQGGPGALAALELLASRLPAGVDVGLGRVMVPQDVVRAADAGARFIACPHTASDVIHAARNLGLPCYPGALTPSEIQLAWRAGASAVALFPAASLGVGYLSAVRAALPGIGLVAAGPVAAGEAAQWLAAGAAAVVLGPDLLGDALFRGGDLEALTARTRSVLAAAAQVPR